MTIVKRFIAGALCPQCGAQDRLRVYRLGDMDHRECVACGFADALRWQRPARELDTRVNRGEAPIEPDTQVLKLPLEPGAE